jgi:hypothetical protein
VLVKNSTTFPITTRATEKRRERDWAQATIPRWLWMITEAEKGYFGLDTPDF